MSDSYEDLVVQLETISEQLGDRSMSVLTDAISAGAKGRPTEDKLLGRARSAVDKAIMLLRQIDDDSDG